MWLLTVQFIVTSDNILLTSVYLHHKMPLLEMNIFLISILARIAMAEAAFNKRRALFTSKMDSELRKKLVKCYIWRIASYGAEIWTLGAVDHNHLKSFETRCWRRMELIK
jgi:hypothetical protein